MEFPCSPNLLPEQTFVGVRERKETKAIRHFRRQWTIKKILKYISKGKKTYMQLL